MHGVEDVVFAVAVDIEGRVESLLVFQEITFADKARVFGGFVEEDAGVALGDDHFQSEEEFGFDFIEAGAGIEVIDHVVDHKEGIFFHGLFSFELFEISILSHILEIKYMYLKSINLTPEIKHCISD